MIGLSVIVPVYNGEAYIRKCLDSILNQSYMNYELIIIDDGSKDNSLSICREYERRDSRISVIPQQNRGPSAARNLGITAARGTYLTFIDADDYIKPTMFSELVQLMDESRCELAISPMTVEYSYRKRNKMRLPDLAYEGRLSLLKQESSKILALFETELINSPCARIYKTAIIQTNRIVMPDDIHYLEDLIFNVDYLRFCKSIFILNKSFYVYTRKKHGSITTSYRHREFYSINAAHDKILAYLLGSLAIEGDLRDRAYYMFIPATIASFIHLFNQDCPMTRSEKLACIHDIVHGDSVGDKIEKARKPGWLPGMYKLLLQRKHTLLIYYACKFYRYYKMSFQYLAGRLT